MNTARAILAGDRAPETVDALAADLARWISSDGEIPLHRHLGLLTPKRERSAWRDARLRAALALVPGDSRHGRCEILADKIRAFSVRRWPRWEHLPAPPASATELDRLLWGCCRLGCDLPESARQLFRITDTFSPSGDSGPAANIRPLEEQTCT